jgi:hypothetical protein
MNHIASKEGTIFGRRGAGNFVYHESYCDERVVMTIVSSGRGWGYALV